MGNVATSHVVKKGETLDGIARKYRIASWKLIWGHKDNAKLKSKRGKPELIQPGDSFVLPPPKESSITNKYSSNGPRMSIDIDGPKRLIFVQQKWAYFYQSEQEASAWTSSQKADFHKKVDSIIWKYWSGKFTLGVKGKSEFAAVYKDADFTVNFDIKQVKSGGHWKVYVLKLAAGSSSPRAQVDWPGQSVYLSSYDTVIKTVTLPDKRKFKQIAVAHEFGHTAGNVEELKRGDEYELPNPYFHEKKSMMNLGMKLDKRHARTLIEAMDKIIPNTSFYVKRVG